MEFLKDDIVYYAGKFCRVLNVYPDRELKYTASARYTVWDDEGEKQMQYIRFTISDKDEPYMHLVKRKQ